VIKILLFEPYGFIYITTNNVNGKKYIGQKKIDNRAKTYLGSGKIFKQALRKYGKKNFTREIVAIGYNAKDLNELEKYYIELHDAVNSDRYYNIADGGNSGSKFAGKTKEEMIVIGKKISEAGKGIIVSDNTKQKMSDNHADCSGENNPNYGRLGANSQISKSVICVTTNEVFGSTREVERNCGILHSDISACCNGRQKSAGKHPITGEKLVWQYYEDYIKEKEREVA